MATNQSAVKKQDEWQDYTPAAGGGDGWQDYAPAKPARAPGPVTPAEIESISPKTQFEKDRPGEGISLKGSGTAAWNTLKGAASGLVKQIDPTSGLSGAGLSKVGINPHGGTTSDRLNEIPIVQAAKEAKAGWQRPTDVRAKIGEAVTSGLGSLVGMSGKSAAEHGERGEGGAIIGDAAVPAVTAIAGPLAAEGLSKAVPAVRNASFKEYPTSGPQLTRGASRLSRAAGTVAGGGLGSITGIPGAGYAGGVAGFELGPTLMEKVLGTPELGSTRNPGPFSKIPTRAPKAAAPIPVEPPLGSPENPGFHSKLPTRMPAKIEPIPEPPPLGSPENPGWHSKVPTRMPEKVEQVREPELGSPENPGWHSKVPNRMPRTIGAPEPPAAEGPGLPKAQVVKLPVPREPVPTDNPGYMHSIPRAKLLDLARQGRPGAGQQLQNIGKTPLYVPESYPGPRPEGLQHVEPRYAYRAHDIGAPEKMDLERSHAHATLDPEEALRYKQGRNSGVEQTTSKNDLSKLKEGFDYELVPGPNGKQWVKYRTPRAKSEFEPHE